MRSSVSHFLLVTFSFLKGVTLVKKKKEVCPSHRALCQSWDHVSQSGQRLVDHLCFIQHSSLCSSFTHLSNTQTQWSWNHWHELTLQQITAEILWKVVKYSEQMIKRCEDDWITSRLIKDDWRSMSEDLLQLRAALCLLTSHIDWQMSAASPAERRQQQEQQCVISASLNQLQAVKCGSGAKEVRAKRNPFNKSRSVFDFSFF